MRRITILIGEKIPKSGQIPPMLTRYSLRFVETSAEHKNPQTPKITPTTAQIPPNSPKFYGKPLPKHTILTRS